MIHVKGHARGTSIVRAYTRKGGENKGTTLWRRNRARALSQASWNSALRAKSPTVREQRKALHFRMNSFASQLDIEIKGKAKSISRRGGTRKHSTYSRFK